MRTRPLSFKELLARVIFVAIVVALIYVLDFAKSNGWMP